MDTTVRMAIYRGRSLIDFYDVALDDHIEKHMRWFIGAVQDEGGNRVRVSTRDDDGKVIESWESRTDEYYDEFMESLIETLIEERFLGRVDHDGDV